MRRPRPRARKQRRMAGAGESLLAGILGISLALWCIMALTARLSPVLSTLVKAQTERRVTEVVAERLREALAAQGGSPVVLERDGEGRPSALKADAAALNRLREELLRGVSEELEGLRKEKVGVPMGSLTPWRSFYGTGPEVKVGIYAASTVSAEFSSHFSQAGVNQTRHVIELEVAVTLQLLLPGGVETQEIKTVVPVAETVIVGAPPEEYFEAGTVRE